jgi:uncharacterized protein YkwD
MIEGIIILAVVVAVYFLFLRKKDKETTKEDTDIHFIYSEFETNLISLINEHRTYLGLQEVKLNNYISSKCLEHNNYMIKQGKSSHDYFDDRAEAITNNLGASEVGENVAYNFSTPNSTLHAWLQSPGHKENLENPNWNTTGIAKLGKFTTNIFAQVKNN